MKIPFNQPYHTGMEVEYIKEVFKNNHLSGDGPFTKKCHTFLEKTYHCPRVLLTHSCTAALEMSALLIDIKPGDEVILPSYTFVSSANAFVLFGAIPVFVDIRSDTLNIDETLIEAAITEKTRAIVVVHYAGVSCEMEKIMQIAQRHNLFVIEDAAQAIHSTYNNKPVGVYGDLATLSFHETKNINCGEGGALIINNPNMVKRAEIIREKGTNRTQFFCGEVDKYTWVDKGSSYLPSELLAAYLYAQLENIDKITQTRRDIWNQYHQFFELYAKQGLVQRPSLIENSIHNAHIYYILLPDEQMRNQFIALLKERNIHTVFHYIPLHNSPAGNKYGKVHGNMSVTNSIHSRLVRLPIWVGLTAHLSVVLNSIKQVLAALNEKVA